MAGRMARQAGLRWGERHVFLDDSLNPDDLESSWRLAKKRFVHHGVVIVIAHPHPQTLEFLAHGVQAGDMQRIVPLKYALSSSQPPRLAAGRTPVLQ